MVLCDWYKGSRLGSVDLRTRQELGLMVWGQRLELRILRVDLIEMELMIID